jgi:hypothetical protein
MAADRSADSFDAHTTDSYGLDAIRAIQATQLNRKQTKQPRMDANGFEKKAEPQMNTNARRYGPTSRQRLSKIYLR